MNSGLDYCFEGTVSAFNFASVADEIGFRGHGIMEIWDFPFFNHAKVNDCFLEQFGLLLVKRFEQDVVPHHLKP